MSAAQHKVLDLPIHYVLQQVTNSVRHYAPDLRMTIDPCAPETTWTSVLAVVSGALKPSDKETMILSLPNARREGIKKFLFPPDSLSDAAKPLPSSTTTTAQGLPIRTPVATNVTLPQKALQRKEALRKMEKELEDFLDLYDPLPALPNSRSGIILDRKGFPDSIVRTETPRMILERRRENIEDIKEDIKEDISEDINVDGWGTINVPENVDADGVVHDLRETSREKQSTCKIS